MDKKICAICGVEKEVSMFTASSRGKNKYHCYCKICLNEKYKVTMICECCGKEFRTKHKTSRFCSFKCSNSQFDKKITYNCDFCGKVSSQTNFEYNRYKNHYCSIDCKNNHRGELYSGKNAPMYGKEGLKGDKSPLWNPNLTNDDREKGRKIEGYNDFIKNVYQRDDYTCQYCNKKSNGDIVAHHLNGYSWDKENRTNVDNGVTLCECCHKKFHNIYGVKNNTKEQFEEWIKDKCQKSA